MVSDTDRPNGILNEKGRNYLLGNLDTEPKSQEERDNRRYVRERLLNSILDFSVLYGEDGHRVESRDRWRVFGGTQPPEGSTIGPRIGQHFGGLVEDADELAKTPDEEMQEAFVDAIAFLYSVISDSGLDPDHILKRGIHQYAEAELAEYIQPQVLLKVDTRESRARRAQEKIMEGRPPEELTDEEVRAALEMSGGPLTAERIQAYLRGEWAWPPEELSEMVESGETENQD